MTVASTAEAKGAPRRAAPLKWLVPAVITGYYGMNVLTYPHSGTAAGGYAALGLMVGIVALLYVLFKRIDWL